ncbi:MAG: M23 family metallopeptidase [Candidatus Caldatribacteriota bacterium]
MNRRVVKINKNIRINNIKILVILVLVLLFCLPGNSESNNQEIDEEKARLKKIEEQMQTVKKELDNLQKEEKGYLEALHKIEKLLSETEKELNSIEKDIELVRKELTQLEDELAKNNQLLKERAKILEDRLREIYKHDRLNYLIILLNSKNFTDFLNYYQYIKSILKEDREIIENIAQQIREIEEKKLSLENRQEILDLLQKEVAKEKENIEYSLNAKKSIIDKINTQKAAYLKSLEELEQSSQEIKGIIEQIYQQQKEEAKAKPEIKQDSGTVLTPKKGIFALPVKGKVISNFGRQLNDDFNTYTFNSGIDISAPLGEVVKAAASGEVIYIGNIKGYGQIVIIDHGGRTTTLYAHLSKIIVQVGDQVKKGAIIAQVGDSGGVSTPRLHFEVRVEGKPTDPMNWL